MAPQSASRMSVVDLQRALRQHLDRLGELPAVHGPGAEELEDDEVEGALQEVDLLPHHA